MIGRKTKTGNIAKSEIEKSVIIRLNRIIQIPACAGMTDGATLARNQIPPAAVDSQFSKMQRQIDTLDLRFSQKFNRVVI